MAWVTASSLVCVVDVVHGACDRSFGPMTTALADPAALPKRRESSGLLVAGTIGALLARRHRVGNPIEAAANERVPEFVQNQRTC